MEAKRKMDPHTRKIRNREKAAKSMLWVASMVTIGILISIVGFILFRGFVFSDGITPLDILAAIFLMAAGALSLAVFVQKMSSSRPAKAICWMAIVLLIVISFTGYVQAGDLIDPVDRNLMRLITSGIPVVNIAILVVNLFRFSD